MAAGEDRAGFKVMHGRKLLDEAVDQARRKQRDHELEERVRWEKDQCPCRDRPYELVKFFASVPVASLQERHYQLVSGVIDDGGTDNGRDDRICSGRWREALFVIGHSSPFTQEALVRPLFEFPEYTSD